MIRNDDQLHQAQLDIQTMWQFLETARKTHAPVDYHRLATLYLLQLQEHQQDVVEYLSRQSSPVGADPV